MLTMQGAILRLMRFWTDHGCNLGQPFNTEVGAGTMNPATFLRVLGPEPWNVVYVEPSVRPDDSRYGDNPNRMQTHTQLQVVLKPDPANSVDLYLQSLEAIGIDLAVHDVRFVEDNWESPALGAWGLGWEVWLDGLEITQFTYFQQAGGMQLEPVSVEITYGLERILMALQGVTHFKDIQYSDTLAFGEIVGQAEREMSIYYLDDADIETIRTLFGIYEAEARRLIAAGLPIPAYSYVLRCSHAFNVLDARGAIGATERARSFRTMRGLAHDVSELWIERRAELDHPLGRVEPPPAPEVEPLRTEPPSAPSTFLLELGFEELPPDQVESYRAQLELGLAEMLSQERLVCRAITTVGSPRRIVAQVAEVAPHQTEHVTRVRGPKRETAFDADGSPTRAGTGFAGKHGVEVDELETELVDGVEYVVATRFEPSRNAPEVLAAELPGVIGGLSPRRGMRWSAGPGYSASRALRWMVAMLGDTPIPFAYADVTSAPVTRGLRDGDRPLIDVSSADGYEALLEAHGVIVSGATRRQRILDGAERLTASVGGSIDVVADGEVLDEVTNLVENPQPILGSFEHEYLRLPAEVLTVVMKKHQRYLPVRDAAGELLAHFVSVANGPVDADAVRAGNEAVLRARFADAAFFFDRDREKPLESYRAGLAQLIFEEQAGSMLDRADRIERLASELAAELELDPQEATMVRRAAHLALADLATSLVVELSSLAGQVGRVYALADGEPEPVADAIFEAALPRHAGDQLPGSRLGAVVAIANRTDELVSLFAAGAKPTGSADPYGLRRSATGLVQILAHHELPLRLSTLFRRAADQLAEPVPDAVLDDLTEFVGMRLEVRLVEEGHDVELVRALANRFDVPAEVEPLLHELEALQGRADFVEIVEAYRRTSRIAADATSLTVNEALLQDDAEKALWRQFEEAEPAMLEAPSLTSYFDTLGSLAPSIATFFDDVLVMAEDPELRENRLALLRRISATGQDLLLWEALPGA